MPKGVYDRKQRGGYPPRQEKHFDPQKPERVRSKRPPEEERRVKIFLELLSSSLTTPVTQ